MKQILVIVVGIVLSAQISFAGSIINPQPAPKQVIDAKAFFENGDRAIVVRTAYPLQARYRHCQQMFERIVIMLENGNQLTFVDHLDEKKISYAVFVKCKKDGSAEAAMIANEDGLVVVYSEHRSDFADNTVKALGKAGAL